jgi:penicillin-binding protein 1B
LAPSKARVATRRKVKARGPPRRAAPGFRDHLRALGRSLIVGSLLALGIVGAVLWRWAVGVVEADATGPTWPVPGKVLSGPIEVWSGLSLTAPELAEDLSAAGYARVDRATRPGDFQVSDDAVLVIPRDAKGPGWRTRPVESLVTFRAGTVRSVSPAGSLTLAPATLALVRGPDNENRSPVPLERIPQVLRDAVIASEDARFYDHRGLDPLGVARALWVDLLAGAAVQGGSTITQQVAKNLYLSGERTADRKWKEALIALALEKRRGKDEILRLYLNEVYLGQVAGASVCGMDAAARAYFGKPVERVDLGEAATLAGIIPAPNAYSPVKHPEEATVRRDLVLGRMVEVGAITEDVAAKARKQPLEVHAPSTGRAAPWAVDAAIDEVEAARGEGSLAKEALVAQTTIQPALQRLAERAVAQGGAELVKAHPELAKVQMALVAVRARDGAVVAMVGGRDYGTSGFNRALLAERQLGSTVKPLTLLAAMDADPSLNGATRLDDAPITRQSDGKDWTPANYDGQFVGPIPVRRAIATSRNIPAVLLAERVGLPALSGRLNDLGLARARPYPSMALGGFGATPLALASAYTPFAADGAFHAGRVVRSLQDAQGVTLVDHAATKARVRFSPRATFMARDVLRQVLVDGTGRSASRHGVGPGAAGKSGTTDEYVDAWFVGVTGPYAVAVWVGFDKGRKVGLTGGEAALPTWARFVAWSGTSGQQPKPPEGVEAAEVCVETDLPPCPGCTATRTEYFAAGTVPAATCQPPAVEAVQNVFERIGEALGIGR